MNGLDSILLDATIKGTLILALALAANLTLRRASAASRHLLWSLAIAGLLLLPLLAAIMPVWRFGVPADFRLEVTAARAEPAPTPAAAPGASSTIPSSGQRAAPASESSGRFGWLPWLWLAGASIVLMRLAGGVIGAVRIARRANPIGDRETLGLLEELRRHFGIRRPVRLLESSATPTPAVWGLWRPVVLLPAAASEWSWEKTRVVLAHELAHVKRFDSLHQFAAEAACAIYWFHPLVWLAARQLVKERELACDDQVLAGGSKPEEYARHLLEIARSARTAGLAWGAAAMARRSQLEGRLLAVLDGKRTRGGPARGFTMAAASAAAVLVALLASAQPRTEPPDPHLHRSFAAMEHALGTMHPDLVADLRRLASAYKSSAQPEMAQILESRAKLINDTAGVRFGETLRQLREREAAYRLSYDYPTAQAFFEEALATRRALLPPHDPEIASNLDRLGFLFHRQGRDLEAEAMLQSALFIKRTVLGAEHHEVATTLELYAAVLREGPRAKEAAEMLETAQRLRAAHIRAVWGGDRTEAELRPAHKVGGGVQPPRLIHKRQPELSDFARFARHEGTVVLRVEIEADGTPRLVELLKSLGFGLDEKAAEAISQWVFQPGEKDGHPVPVAATINVNFRML